MPISPRTKHNIYHLEAIPPELRSLPRWVCWQSVPDPKGRKPGKLPKNPHTGGNAMCNNPATWGTFAQTFAALPGFDGLSFVLNGDGVVGIDLDKCRNVTTGVISGWALEVIKRFNSYTEISPSGTGIRIFLRGQLPPDGRHKGDVEVYADNKFLTVTGNKITSYGAGDGIEDRADELLAWHREVFGTRPTRKTDDGELVLNDVPTIDPLRLEQLFQAKPKARELFNGERNGYASQSEADMALANYASAAGWAGQELCDLLVVARSNGNADKNKPLDYYARTIDKACEGRAEEVIEAPAGQLAEGVRLEDFYAYMPGHSYLFMPNRGVWPCASINARFGRVGELKASTWLDQNRAVEQMTWMPGEPLIIMDRLLAEGGWIDRPGCACLNLYIPPQVERGDHKKVGKWFAHIQKVYPNDWQHIVCWLAHRVQRPGEKVNHALLLGGPQGIGKDSLLEPVKYAVGPWNFAETSPIKLVGRFNLFIKSVVLRVSEARDLGEVNRYTFYQHTKTYTAAPPDVLTVDEKFMREYPVPNVCGVVITTNHRTDGIYLPADDRRHYVAWSPCVKEDFDTDYWNSLWKWYAEGGRQNVAAYLARYDLSTFDPKAPPPHTPAWYAIVDTNQATEQPELRDLLDKMDNPKAVTIALLVDKARMEVLDIYTWLADRGNRRTIGHRLESVGYVQAPNPDATDRLWVLNGRRQVVYAKSSLSTQESAKAAWELKKSVESVESVNPPPVPRFGVGGVDAGQ